MTDTTVAPEFRVGKVLARSLDLLFRNLVPIVGLTALIVVPLMASGLALYFYFVGAAIAEDQVGPVVVIGAVALVIGVMLVYQLTTAVIIHAVFRSLRGRAIRLSASLGAAWRRFGAVILLALVSALGIGFGTMLLIVPGMILVALWAVAVPACVVERLGPIESLGRSRELTRGRRWPIFGLLLVIGIASNFGNYMIEAIVGGAGLGDLLGSIVVLLWYVVYLAFSAIAVTVAYHDLRAEKEGIDIEQIAELFA